GKSARLVRGAIDNLIVPFLCTPYVFGEVGSDPDEHLPFVAYGIFVYQVYWKTDRIDPQVGARVADGIRTVILKTLCIAKIGSIFRIHQRGLKNQAGVAKIPFRK